MAEGGYRFRIFARYWLPVFVMLSLIRLESTLLMSGANTGHMLALLLSWLHLHPSSSQVDLINMVLRKCGHFLGYGVLGLLVFRAFKGAHLCKLHGYGWWRKAFHRVDVVHDAFTDFWRWSWAGYALGLVFLVAASDEFHQSFLPGRTASPFDVMIDCSGAVLLLAITRMFTSRQMRIDG